MRIEDRWPTPCGSAVTQYSAEMETSPIFRALGGLVRAVARYSHTERWQTPQHSQPLAGFDDLRLLALRFLLGGLGGRLPASHA